MKKKWQLLFLFVLLFSACKDQSPLPPEGSLEAFMIENPQLAVSNQLIACAAGGQENFLEDPDFPISVFFLPIDGATNFSYYEATGDAERDDLSLYQERNFILEPVFNGYLMRFLHPGVSKAAWGRVTYVVGDSLHICNAIRLKMQEKPSEFAPDLLDISFTTNTTPRFRWQDGQIKENEIYFQVVSDEDGNLISGTYTYDSYFQFYDLSNVVLNIRDVDPPPVLAPSKTYYFTLMGVSIDNWVNLIAQKPFLTQ